MNKKLSKIIKNLIIYLAMIAAVIFTVVPMHALFTDKKTIVSTFTIAPKVENMMMLAAESNPEINEENIEEILSEDIEKPEEIKEQEMQNGTSDKEIDTKEKLSEELIEEENEEIEE